MSNLQAWTGKRNLSHLVVDCVDGLELPFAMESFVKVGWVWGGGKLNVALCARGRTEGGGVGARCVCLCESWTGDWG